MSRPGTYREVSEVAVGCVALCLRFSHSCLAQGPAPQWGGPWVGREREEEEEAGKHFK